MFSSSTHIKINRKDKTITILQVPNFWNQPSVTCNWRTAYSPNEATMTSSSVLNTELTAIRAIIPAERASVHWLHSESQCNSVWVGAFRKIDCEGGVMLNCADHKAWSVAFNCLILSQRWWVVRSGEQGCTILPEARSVSFWKLSIGASSHKDWFDITPFWAYCDCTSARMQGAFLTHC